jgi:hypothetical protein
MTAHWSNADLEMARKRGEEDMAKPYRAVAARYDQDSGRVIVDLINGASFAFPARLAQGLCDATPEQLAEIEISPYGFGLHWPQIDMDFRVEGLMNGIFGTRAYMAAQAGRAKSAAKAAAARSNGKKGGRPSKAA